MSRRILSTLVLGAALACVSTAASAAVTETPGATAIDGSARLGLDPGDRHAVQGLELKVGDVALTLDDGVVLGTRPVAGRVIEAVFLGRGRLRHAPVDAVEAYQLGIFTGAPALDIPFEDAVLAIGEGATMDVLRAGAAPAAAPSDEGTRARALYERWQKSAERQRAGIRALEVRVLAGEPGFEVFRAAWVDAAALHLEAREPWQIARHKKDLRPPDRLMILIEPESTEPFRLTHFVPRVLDTEERWESSFDLADVQGEGHELGVDLDRLGRDDTWSAGPRRGADGAALSGRSGVEPEHYVLDVRVEKGGEEIAGTARITLRALRTGVRTVSLTISPDIHVTRVATEEEAALPIMQDGPTVVAVLPKAWADGERHDVTVAFEGTALEKLRRGEYTSWTDVTWYPHAGTFDHATYDCTYHWPKKLTLLAAGKQVAGGEDGDLRWSRRTVDRAVTYVGFELGDFEIVEESTPGLTVRAAFCRTSQEWLRDKSEHNFAKDALEMVQYFSRVYGQYPYDELTVVTTPFSATRTYSLAMPGMVSVLDLELRRGHGRTQGSDYRMVLAHEIAHQWWGMLAWTNASSSRWISEGMSEFSALRFGREQQSKGRPFVSPLRYARQVLGHVTRSSSRPVEWYGPIVLGPRLDSSLCRGCDEPVVYWKGAMLLEMLALTVGDATFDQALRRVLQHDGEPLTTEALLAAVATTAETDLGEFDRQFVRGVGMPRVFYTYTAEPREGGGWSAKIHIGQRPPWFERRSIVRRETGTLDLDVQRAALGARLGSLSIPFKLQYFKPDDPDLKNPEYARRAKLRGNFTKTGVLTLGARPRDLSIDLQYQPLRFRLDPDSSVAIQTFDGTTDPREILRVQAADALASGDTETAESLLRTALEAEPPDWVRQDEEFEIRQRYRGSPIHAAGVRHTVENRQSDLRAHVQLARIRLHQDRLDDAWKELAEARRHEDRMYDPDGYDELTVLEVRLLLRAKRNDEAYSVAWKRVSDGQPHIAEAWAVGAIVATAKGDQKFAEKALDECGRVGIDTSVLSEGK